MRALLLATLLLVAMSGLAQARCADEVKELQARVERQQKARPTPQTGAALKELGKAQTASNQLAELDCYNAVARARKALEARQVPAQVKD